MRRHGLLLALLAAMAVPLFIWSANDQIGYLGGDGANYLMMAEHFAWYGARDAVYDGVATVSRFPPGLPLLLGMFDASSHLLRAHAVTMACLLFALAALHAWLLGEGFSRAQAILGVLLLAILPGTLRLGLLIQSEYLYLFLSLVALSLVREFQRSQHIEALYGAAAMIAMAALTREIGIALFAPLLLVLRRRSMKTVAITLTIAVLPLVDWHLLHHSPLNYGKVLHDNYQSGFARHLQDQLATELPALRDGFGENLMHIDAFAPIGYGVGAICFAALLWRALRRRIEAVYCVANLAILVVWPYPEEAARFLWVLLPLLLVQPLLLLAELRHEPAGARTPGAALGLLAGALLTMALPALAFMSTQYRDAQYSPIPGARGYLAWYLTDRDQARYEAGFDATVIDLLQRAQAIVPLNDCVMAPRPDMVSYFARRRSYFHPVDAVPDAQFETAMRANGCHYAMVYLAYYQHNSTRMYPAERIKGFSDVVLEGRLPQAGPDKKPVCQLWRMR